MYCFGFQREWFHPARFLLLLQPLGAASRRRLRGHRAWSLVGWASCFEPAAFLIFSIAARSAQSLGTAHALPAQAAQNGNGWGGLETEFLPLAHRHNGAERCRGQHSGGSRPAGSSSMSSSLTQNGARNADAGRVKESGLGDSCSGAATRRYRICTG